jgi:transposase
MKEYSMVVGLDLGDKSSCYCTLDLDGEILGEGSIRTTEAGVRAQFGRLEPSLVAIETGTHTWWIEKLLLELGHEVVVANARKVRAISQNDRKNDRADAEMLARLARSDRGLLCPVKMRGEQAQKDLLMLKARDVLVRARAKMVNTARGMLKSLGTALPACSTDAFARKARSCVPAEYEAAMAELLDTIETTTQKIRDYERKLEAMASEKYPEAEQLQEIAGVGPLTSLAFVLVIEDPSRFGRSRDVGPYLGLTPRRDQSGQHDPQLGITKAGNDFLRRLLVGAAQYIMGHKTADSRLRQWAWKLAGGEGNRDKRRKKRAIVALARKLAVVMLSLWKTGSCYEPFPESASQPERAL